MEKILFGRKRVDMEMEFVEYEGNDIPLEYMQEQVGGYIENFGLGDGLYMILNEEGKLNNFAPNFGIEMNGSFDVIVGNVLFMRFSDDGERAVSLNDEDVKILKNFFREDEGKRDIDIFVYGTLKRGYHNHRLLKEAQFLGEAWLENYGVFDVYNGGFPGIKLCEGKKVYGQVYRINEEELKRVDRLEGYRGKGIVGNMYEREEVEVKLSIEGGGYIPCDVSVYVWNSKRENEYIESGIWKK